MSESVGDQQASRMEPTHYTALFISPTTKPRDLMLYSPRQYDTARVVRHSLLPPTRNIIRLFAHSHFGTEIHKFYVHNTLNFQA